MDTQKKYKQNHPELIKEIANRYARKIAKKVAEERVELAKLYNNECFICFKPYAKLFVFHHLWYNKLKYNRKGYNARAVVEEVRKNPKQFLLTCRACHADLEFYKRRPKSNKRLNKAIMMSI